MIFVLLTNVNINLWLPTILYYQLTLVMTMLLILTIAATEVRVNHRKHKRLKRNSTCKYYVYGTKTRLSRIGIKRHVPKLYGYLYLFRRARTNVVLSTTSTVDPDHPHQSNFDTDSFIIGLDNHASRTLSNNKHHFVGYIRKLENVYINGISGRLQIRGIGTVRWKIEDDNGRVHTICIPNTFYVPQLEHCILSPQHWAQEADDHSPLMNGITSTTQAQSELLRWSQGKYQRTVMMDPENNTPRF